MMMMRWLLVVLLAGIAGCGAGAKHGAPAPKMDNAADASVSPAGVRGTLHAVGLHSEDVTLDGRTLVIEATSCAERNLPVVRITAKYHAARDPNGPLTELFTVVLAPDRMPRGEKFVPTLAAEERSGVAAGISVFLAEGLALPHDAWIIVDHAELNGPIDVRLWADFGKVGTLEGRLVVPEVRSIVCSPPAPTP